jgi:glycosyltransferase involved in cell wall biosynthesis
VGAPLFSIITPCLNGAQYLEGAIESVVRQRGADFEHIVVDGGSTDDTLAILARHRHVRLLSEPDRGLYDANNKGLRVARGGIIGILNSDDYYTADAFSAVAAAFADSAVSVVTGGAEVFMEENGMRRIERVIAGNADLRLDLRNVLAGVPVLNARFFRRSFVDILGGFDIALRIAADREWLVRAALLRPTQTVLSQTIYAYRQHDQSLTVHTSDRNVAAYRGEHVTLAETHLASGTLRDEDRRALAVFHRRESTAVATLSLCAGELSEFANWVRRGWQTNRLWPFAFAWRLAAHMFGR